MPSRHGVERRVFGLPFRHHPELGEHDHTQNDEHHRGYAVAPLHARNQTKPSTNQLEPAT